MMSISGESDESKALHGARIAFVDKLAGMSQRDARKLVRQHGGIVVDKTDSAADYLVVGEYVLPANQCVTNEPWFDESTREASESGRVRIIRETELWQKLGLVDLEKTVRHLYTPAMLADLLRIPVSLIRRWHRRGVIVPVREVRRLAYFDFQEVATARRLAELLSAGCSPETIERKLAELDRHAPEVERPLSQLSVIVHGKQLLLRQREGLVEPGGQLRFEFTQADDRSMGATDTGCDQEPFSPSSPILSLTDHVSSQTSSPSTPDEMLALAADLEVRQQFAEAAEMYRVALAAVGPDAEINFWLAELLYRMEDLPAARERYYAAIELDEDYIEARASLGSVLAQLGEYELAVAAFEGALAYHRDYPDAHFHLARALDELDRPAEALTHWRAFVELVPDSPWADEAYRRLASAPPREGSRDG